MNNQMEIRFSQEELLYLLRSLGLPDLPGMGEHPWGHIPQESSFLVMESVARSLLARGVIRIQDAHIVADEKVSQLLTTSAFPKQMVVLTYSQGGVVVNKNFYRGQRFDVEHTLPYPWIHDFKSMPTSDMGLGTVQNLLNSIRTGRSTRAFLTNQSKLDEIRKIAASDTDSATKQLADLGLTVNAAKLFTHVLVEPDLKLLIQAVYQLSGELHQNLFTILSNTDSCWLVSGGQPGDDHVQVMGLDDQRLEQVIHAAFQPFQKT